MIPTSLFNLHAGWSTRRNRGVSTVICALMLVLILSMAALSVDVGYLFLNYAQLQSCADSGALAGASQLINDGIVKHVPDYTSGQSAAREAAVEFGSANRVGNSFPSIDSNNSNESTGDVVIGYMSDPTDPSCTLDTSNPGFNNAVQVQVRKSAQQNGVVEASFSRVLGNTGQAMGVKATAVMSSSIVGFQVTSETRNAGLLPFAVKQSNWDAMIAGAGSDLFKYNSNGSINDTSDGILELSMFPLSNGSSGNFGTVDIGSSNNSTADLSRQIRYGVSRDDLAHFGGALMLGAHGTLLLNGDTGISAAIKDDLESVKGQPRSLPIYSTVVGNGNNAMYTIVGFVGVRIMKVKLVGNPKYVIIQPAAVVDATGMIGNTANQSKYIYSNVRLVR